jgi:hypothetical protein
MKEREKIKDNFKKQIILCYIISKTVLAVTNNRFLEIFGIYFAPFQNRCD